MNKEKLKEFVDAAVTEALVNEIVARVLLRLAEAQKRALVVFTGSLIGFEQSMAALKRLGEEGFRFTVYLSESGEALLDLERLRRALKPEAVFTGKERIPEQLAAEFATILVPAITVNTAAKLACCVSDTAATRIISNSMMRGKNVIIAVDGCCPDNPERALKGYHMTPSMKAQLRENMEKLKSFGASLTTIERLYEKTMGVTAGNAQESQTPKGEERFLSKKVVGRKDILENCGCRRIRVSKGAAVTQLAIETAVQYGIAVVRE